MLDCVEDATVEEGSAARGGVTAAVFRGEGDWSHAESVSATTVAAASAES